MEKSHRVRRALGAAAAMVCLIGSHGVVGAQSPTPSGETVVTTNRNCRELAADLRQRATDLLASSAEPNTTMNVVGAAEQAAAFDGVRSTLSGALVEPARHADVVAFGSEQVFWVRANEYEASNPPGRPDAVAVLATDDGVIVIEQKPRYVVLFRYDDFGKKQRAKLRVEGQFIRARLVDGAVQLMSEAPPQLKGTDAAAIAATKNHHWIPRYAWRAPDGSWERKVLTRCTKTYVPEDLSGFSVVSLTSLDPDTLEPTPGVGVVTDNPRVAVKGQRAVVVTPRSLPAATTTIHEFDLSNPLRATHRASMKTSDSVESFGLVDKGRVGAALCAPTSGSVQSDQQDCSIATFEATDGGMEPVARSASIGTEDKIRWAGFLDTVAVVRTDSTNALVGLGEDGELAMSELDPDLYIGRVQQLTDDRLLFADADYLQLFDVSDAAAPIRLSTYGDPPPDYEFGVFSWATTTFPNSFDWDPDQQLLSVAGSSISVNDPVHTGGRAYNWLRVWKITNDQVNLVNFKPLSYRLDGGSEFRTRIEGDAVRVAAQGWGEERFGVN